MKFLRRISNRISKLGKRRKKKQVWRRPTGRDNKMREKRRGYPAIVSVGYKKNKKIRGKIKEKTPIMVNNVRELEEVKKDQIVLIGKVGKKKKMEIVKKAKEKSIEVGNVNVKKFLKKNKIKGKKNESK
jgi:large subunit ribosomal protein L32e